MRLLLHYRSPRETHALDREDAPDVVTVADLDHLRIFLGRPPKPGVIREYDEVPDALHLDHALHLAPRNRSTPPFFTDCAVVVAANGHRWKYSEPADVWSRVDGRLGSGSICPTSFRSYQRLRAEFGPLRSAAGALLAETADVASDSPMRQSPHPYRPDLHPGQSAEWRSGPGDLWLTARVVRVIHERDDSGPFTSAVVQPCPGGVDLGVERTLVGPTLATCLRTHPSGPLLPIAPFERSHLSTDDLRKIGSNWMSANCTQVRDMASELVALRTRAPAVPDEVIHLLDRLGAPTHSSYPPAELSVAERLRLVVGRRRPSDRRILHLRAERVIRLMKDEITSLRDGLLYGLCAARSLREPLARSLREYGETVVAISTRAATLERRISRVRAIAGLPEAP